MNDHNDNIPRPDANVIANSMNIGRICTTVFWCTIVVCATAIAIAYILR